MQSFRIRWERVWRWCRDQQGHSGLPSDPPGMVIIFLTIVFVASSLSASETENPGAAGLRPFTSIELAGWLCKALPDNDGRTLAATLFDGSLPAGGPGACRDPSAITFFLLKSNQLNLRRIQQGFLDCALIRGTDNCAAIFLGEIIGEPHGDFDTLEPLAVPVVLTGQGQAQAFGRQTPLLAETQGEESCAAPQ